MLGLTLKRVGFHISIRLELCAWDFITKIPSSKCAYTNNELDKPLDVIDASLDGHDVMQNFWRLQMSEDYIRSWINFYKSFVDKRNINVGISNVGNS